MRCCVRVPPKASRKPPGRSALATTAQVSGRKAMPVPVPSLAHEFEAVGRVGYDGVDRVEIGQDLEAIASV